MAKGRENGYKEENALEAISGENEEILNLSEEDLALTPEGIVATIIEPTLRSLPDEDDIELLLWGRKSEGKKAKLLKQKQRILEGDASTLFEVGQMSAIGCENNKLQVKLYKKAAEWENKSAWFSLATHYSCYGCNPYNFNPANDYEFNPHRAKLALEKAAALGLYSAAEILSGYYHVGYVFRDYINDQAHYESLDNPSLSGEEKVKLQSSRALVLQENKVLPNDKERLKYQILAIQIARASGIDLNTNSIHPDRTRNIDSLVNTYLASEELSYGLYLLSLVASIRGVTSTMDRGRIILSSDPTPAEKRLQAITEYKLDIQKAPRAYTQEDHEKNAWGKDVCPQILLEAALPSIDYLHLMLIGFLPAVLVDVIKKYEGTRSQEYRNHSLYTYSAPKEIVEQLTHYVAREFKDEFKGGNFEIFVERGRLNEKGKKAAAGFVAHQHQHPSPVVEEEIKKKLENNRVGFREKLEKAQKFDNALNVLLAAGVEPGVLGVSKKPQGAVRS